MTSPLLYLIIFLAVAAVVLLLARLQFQQHFFRYNNRHGLVRQQQHHHHHHRHWRPRRGDEGFIAFGADTELQTPLFIPLYSTSKPVLKLFDSLFFDASNGNLIEVIGPSSTSSSSFATTQSESSKKTPPLVLEVESASFQNGPRRRRRSGGKKKRRRGQREREEVNQDDDDDDVVTAIVVTTRANRAAKYSQPTGDNAVVSCPESLMNAVDPSRIWFTYFTSSSGSDGDNADDGAYAVFYAAWDSATYLHVIDLETNVAVCSHRIAPSDQQVLLYTNAAIVFGLANPFPQFQQQHQQQQQSSSPAAAIPGYPNAVYRLSATGFLDPANGYLVLANPGAGQVMQYDRKGNAVVATAAATTALPTTPDLVGWSVVQGADMFVYLASGNETVVMQVQNTGTVVEPRYTLVNVSCYLVGGPDAAVTAAAPVEVPPASPVVVNVATASAAQSPATPPPAPIAETPPAPVAETPPPPLAPLAKPGAAPAPATLSSDLDPLALNKRQQPFATDEKKQQQQQQEEEQEDDNASNKESKKRPRRVDGVDPQTAFGAMVRKPSNYKPSLASVVF